MENLHSPKEGRFAGLDAIPDFRKIAAFEDRLEKPKPLLEGPFSSFAGPKCLQHGAVEHYCAMLERKIARNPYTYWLLELLMWRFWATTVQSAKCDFQTA